MDDKGQVYFGADDKEVPEEDAKRYKEALREEVKDLREAISGDRHYCRLLIQDHEGPWIPERSEVEEFQRQIEETHRAQKQEEKPMRIEGQIFQNMPNPTDEDLRSPEFEAVWNVIKSWDVNVPEFYDGYCGATGSHVKLILNALKEIANVERATP